MKKIPDIPDPSIYTEAAFIDSGFVELVSNDLWNVKMMYPLLGMKNAESRCFMRKEAYAKLTEAAKRLPEGYRFRIWDAWRPFALQQELFREYAEDIIAKFNLEDCDNSTKSAYVSKFVSPPVNDEDVPPAHTTGGAVDLTILDPQGNELDMGSGFDEFTDRTHTAYYEINDGGDRSRTIRENRRLLYHVMTESGFTNLPSEWWHYDYGDRFWAYYTKQPALYRGVFTGEGIYEH